MHKGGGVILDFTGERVMAGLLDPAGALSVLSDFAPPFRVAVRNTGGDLITLAGQECDGIVEDDQTLLFDNLGLHLPRIEDEELQQRIISAFWKSLCDALAERKLVESAGAMAAYVICPYNWPAPLLERFREACAGERRINPVGFPNEAVSLLVGRMQDVELRKLVRSLYSSTPMSLCLVVAGNDDLMDVCRFDLSLGEGDEQEIVIQDFFRAKQTNPTDKLKSRDWSGQPTTLFLLEGMRSLDGDQKKLADRLEGVFQQVEEKQCPLPHLQSLKLRGAAYIAQCAGRSNRVEDRYLVQTAYNIGVRVNQARFHPIIRKSELVTATRFPFDAEQSFSLKGRPGSEMRIEAHCGYSDLVDESTPIARFTLSAEEIASVTADRKARLVASVAVVSPGSGRITLRVVPGEQTIGSKEFVLPALMV
ncbi:MAG TPA: hypothetical protein VKA70_18235 [Blastocatellia bacterium]|nr:hypothetical protein [Blastocatellia bacterium]